MSDSILNMEQVGAWKINKNGGVYSNGKALNLETRQEIVRRWINGQNVTSIARDLKVTHGVVSKITRQFKETNSILPKMRTSRSKSKFSIDSILDQSKPASSPARPVFTPTQTAILGEAFSKNEYPSETEKENLAQKTGLNMDKITTWFNNKRSRARKQAVNRPSTSTTSSTMSSPISTPETTTSPVLLSSSSSTASTPLFDQYSKVVHENQLYQALYLLWTAQQFLAKNNSETNRCLSSDSSNNFTGIFNDRGF